MNEFLPAKCRLKALHSRVIGQSVSPKFIELCMETDNNRNICHRVLLLKRKHISPEFRHIESNNSFSARTIQVARTSAITPLLTYTKALLGRHFNVTQPINLEIRTFSITKRRTLSSLNVVKRQFI